MDNKISEVRRNVLNSFLENLVCISDKEYQKRIWIRCEGPEVQDFDDAVCDFFDLGEYIFENPKGYGITDGQHHLLIQFRDAFNAFVHSSNAPCFAEEFIDTSEWEKIVAMAQKVLKAFHFPALK